MNTKEKLVVNENLLKRLLTLLENQTRKDTQTIVQLFEQLLQENQLLQSPSC